MQNQWLAALDAADRRIIDPHLNERPFAKGQMLYDAGEAVDEIWFPFTGVVSLMTVLDRDKMVETAVIGREGLVGVSCGPLNGRAVSRAVSQCEGVAACLPAEVFSKAMADSPTMRQSLTRFTESLFAQVQQTAACNAQHRVEERMARWLLTVHDRSDGDCFNLTQQDIADMLGVRRPTVSEVGAALEKKGLIERRRGSICVLERKALERAACGCYATMRKVCEELDVAPVH